MSNKPSLRDHRLKIMEGVFAWEGEIGNARVRKLFGLQPVQASRLMAEFRNLMSNRIIEDSKAKVLKPYEPEEIVTDIALDEYVRQTYSHTDNNPCILDARIDLTQVKPSVFRDLRKASLNKMGVKISYASMANPIYSYRIIFPHSIVQIGRRWHTRAWCSQRKEFRDFTLGRIRDSMPVNQVAPQSSENDFAWNQSMMIELAAHRALSPLQQDVVRNEYFNGNSIRTISIRSCLIQYVIQDLKAAINTETELPPEFQLEVLNSAQFKEFLFKS